MVIPKSTHKERMEQNLDVFDFTLTEQEMQAIRQLDMGFLCKKRGTPPQNISAYQVPRYFP